MERPSARTTWTRTMLAIGVGTALALTSADVGAGTKVRRNLSATGHAPKAHGQVALVIKHHGKRRQGRPGRHSVLPNGRRMRGTDTRGMPGGERDEHGDGIVLPESLPG